MIQGFDRLNIWKGNDNTLPKDMFSEYSFGENNTAGSFFSIIGDFFKGPFLGLLKTSLLFAWDGVIKPSLLLMFGPQILAVKSVWDVLKIIGTTLFEAGRKVWNFIVPRLREWFFGVTTTDEEGGESRVVEPGFWHKIKEFFTKVFKLVKVYFMGDESRGT